MYKNWKAICECEDPVLRLLVATTDDSKVLVGLERGFPELFSGEKEADVRMPLSVLRHAIEHNPEHNNGGDPTINYLCERLGIPMWIFGDQEGDIPIPNEWLALNGVCISETVVHVTYANEDCVILESQNEDFFVITAAKFLDLNG